MKLSTFATCTCLHGVMVSHSSTHIFIYDNRVLTNRTKNNHTLSIYLLTYLLQLEGRRMFFQDMLCSWWHSQAQCKSLQVHYHSRHSWTSDLGSNLNQLNNIYIWIQNQIYVAVWALANLMALKTQDWIINTTFAL